MYHDPCRLYTIRPKVRAIKTIAPSLSSLHWFKRILPWLILAVILAIVAWSFMAPIPIAEMLTPPDSILGVRAEMLLAMPYFVHLTGQEPTHGLAFDTRAQAHEQAKHRKDKPEITYVISDKDRDKWRDREYERFLDGAYTEVPWIGAYARRYPQSRRSDPLDHYAHVSLNSPGIIAYTPSDEFGSQDRQLRIKVGRYLEQFYKDVYSAEQMAEYVAQVKALTGGFKIATSVKDIVSAYLNGPTSCMSHPTSDYRCHPHHPCEVYGDSDLAVAYIGDLASKVTARCLIWPAKKLWCRLYGDEVLKVLLKGAGYTYKTSSNLDHGSLNGAKVRAISHKGKWIMPYVDGANTADLTTDSNGTEWFVLRSDCDGEITVRDADYTDGYANDGSSSRHFCQRCEQTRIDEDESYCSSCEDDRQGSCDWCGTDLWDGDDQTEYAGSYYCENCIDRVSSTCSDCNERIPRGHDRCDSCQDNYSTCGLCGDEYCNQNYSACPDCPPEDEDEDPTPTDDRVIPIPLISIPFIRLSVGDPSICPERVEILYRLRYFAVHRSVGMYETRNEVQLTITHIPTGLKLGHVPDLGTARLRMKHLEQHNGWNCRNSAQLPSSLSRLASAINRGEYDHVAL